MFQPQPSGIPRGDRDWGGVPKREDMFPALSKIELEPLSSDAEPIDYELTLFQALVNEGKHLRVLNDKRPQFVYDEKQLRDAAALEVANQGMGGDDMDKSTRKRKHMNADEKAKQNRDRNREHAKNTRLRKKAYIMKLKELVDQMTRQRDQEEMERKALGIRIYDTNVIRKNAVRLFLSYRAANMRDREKWSAILDESFVFTLPITPYRSFHKADIVSSSRVLVGIDAAIADVASLALAIESIGQNSALWKESIKRGQSCRIAYTTSKEDMLSAGDLIMCRFMLRTEGFEAVGALSGCVQHGMLQCRFNKANKIIVAEMIFDVMGFMQQLQRATAISPETSIIPNTIEMALQPSREARAIMKTDPPFTVVHINDAWAGLSGFSQSDAEGLPLAEVLRVMPSQLDQLYSLASSCRLGRAGSAVLMTHCRVFQGQPALVYLKLFPLTADTESITHFLGIHTDLPLTQAERAALLAHCQGAMLAYAAGPAGPMPGGQMSGGPMSMQGPGGPRIMPPHGPGHPGGHAGMGQMGGYPMHPHGAHGHAGHFQSQGMHMTVNVPEGGYIYRTPSGGVVPQQVGAKVGGGGVTHGPPGTSGVGSAGGSAAGVGGMGQDRSGGQGAPGYGRSGPPGMRGGEQVHNGHSGHGPMDGGDAGGPVVGGNMLSAAAARSMTESYMSSIGYPGGAVEASYPDRARGFFDGHDMRDEGMGEEVGLGEGGIAGSGSSSGVDGSLQQQLQPGGGNSSV